MYFIGYCVGQFSGPFFFKTSEDPRYPTAFRAFYCSVSLMIVIELLLLSVDLREFQLARLTWYRAWVTIQNRRRDARDATLASQETHSSDLLDLTDWETRDFRYIWWIFRYWQKDRRQYSRIWDLDACTLAFSAPFLLDVAFSHS